VDVDAVRETERVDRVVGQDDDEQQRDVEEIPVDVLQDEREGPLAEIRLARLADRAVRRISPERLVVRAAVVIAGDPEAAGRPENQERRRERQRAGPPSRLWPEPGVRALTEEERRIERREVRAKFEVLALKRSPRRVHDECREPEKHRERLNPPE